jgi:hypothetical protein
MNNDEFLKRLDEVAEWHRPQCGPTGGPKHLKRDRLVEHPGELTEQELSEMSETELNKYHSRLMDWLEQQPNYSTGPEIKKLKYEPRSCEDCGKVCKKPRVVEAKLVQQPVRYWRTRCNICCLYQDPATKEFSLNSVGVHNYLGNYYGYLSRRGVAPPITDGKIRQRALAPRVTTTSDGTTVTESENKIIYSYSSQPESRA